MVKWANEYEPKRDVKTSEAKIYFEAIHQNDSTKNNIANSLSPKLFPKS